MKLAIGTVQFGIPYGINNPTGIPSDGEITKIFTLANHAGIKILDTAPAYGNAEEKIAQLSNDQFRIVTKFSSVASSNELKKQILNSLEKLKLKCVYGYLAHNASNLIEFPELWTLLLQAKQEGIIKKIGYSLYSTEQLEKLLDLNLVPDLVQLPYSILDRKFEKYLPQLKKSGTEIHIRSVFLQGLYFMKSSNLPQKLEPLKSNLEELHTCCEKYNISVGALALNFVLENPYIDHVVVGIDKSSQLEENIKMIQNWQQNKELIEYTSQINVTQKELLNPANW